MERSGHPEGEAWGTWEELLLACAVNRHGTRSWDSVAMEIQSRSPFSHLLTPQSCRRRYRDLQLRFGGGDGDGAGDEDDDGGGAGSPVEVPWVEELRKLRVAELRREVERYDASIGYLQLKVKRLEEERERSFRESESGEEKPDREKETSDSPSHTPETIAGDAISGEESGRSCEESNSTLAKGDEKKLEGEDGKGEEAVGTGGDSADPMARPPAGESGESMVAESKGEEEEEEEEEGEGEKESSDVQCSVSLSTRRRGRRRRAVAPGGSSGGEEGEGEGGEEESLITGKRAGGASEPLVTLLETIRSDHNGAILELALGRQDSDRYRSLIRRHVDIEMVRAKADSAGAGSGGGSYTTAELLRDLLLLCTNAIVFYPKDSPESIAAVHLRYTVLKEISASIRPCTPTEPTPPPPPDLDLAASLLHDKPTSAAPLTACRKRSSISNTPTEVKDEEEKPKPEPEESATEEKVLEKNLNKERPVVSRKTRGLRTNKSRGGHAGEGAAAKRPVVPAAPNLKPKPVENTAVAEAANSADKKSSAVTCTASLEKPKRSASSPNRMKRSSKGTPVETLKSSSSRGGGGGGKAAEQKKRGKGNGGKDQRSRQRSGGGVAGGVTTKKAAESSGGGPGKRSVGRPPKRAASPATPRPGKRAKGEAQARKSLPPGSRKRGRR